MIAVMRISLEFKRIIGLFMFRCSVHAYLLKSN